MILPCGSKQDLRLLNEDELWIYTWTDSEEYCDGSAHFLGSMRTAHTMDRVPLRLMDRYLDLRAEYEDGIAFRAACIDEANHAYKLGIGGIG